MSSSKRVELEQHLQGLAEPLWTQQVAHLRAGGLQAFQELLEVANGPFAAAAATYGGDMLAGQVNWHVLGDCNSACPHTRVVITKHTHYL